MKTYATPKEALLEAGRINAITRGRISGDNHKWLEAEIAASRIAISNTTVIKTDTKVAVKSVGSAVKDIAEFTILYHKDAYHAEGPDGKRYGMAEVCNNCRVSLVQNQCLNPTILGDIPVKIIANV